MNVSYQHANPRSGNESFLLRFEPDNTQNPPACILVDAGAGVDVDALLDDDEYLTAIVLTHAHSDHYQSLAANLRDGAPIYASEPTARVLGTVLDDAHQYIDSESPTDTDTEAVLDALEPLSEWESPVQGVRLAPVPAGHTPSAAGFVVQFEDDGKRRTILATGDWTTDRAAGYPGFDTALPVDVGALFLTGATNDAFQGALTDSVGTICKRAVAGSPVLVSASGLTGVRYAYLLGYLADHLERSLSVTLVGHAAKLYEDLDYDLPHVEAVTTYNDPSALLAPGQVTIAGPEVPNEGSSARLFAELRNDPSATLVQITAGDRSPVISAGCTTYDYEVIAHPTEDTVDSVVEEFDPTQVIITHQRGRSAQRYKDRYNSFVWATDDTDEYTIFENGEWVGPPWMTHKGREYVRRNTPSGFQTWLGDGYEGEETIPLPPCERVDESAGVDLAAEGLDTDALEQRLHVSGTDTGTGTEAPMDETGKTTKTSDRAESEGTPVNKKITSEAVTSITSRLNAIEAQLDGTTLAARVVDAGEGVTLLRLLDETNLEHGETVAVTVTDGGKDGREADHPENED